jgi:hypothetical protein
MFFSKQVVVRLDPTPALALKVIVVVCQQSEKSFHDIKRECPVRHGRMSGLLAMGDDHVYHQTTSRRPLWSTLVDDIDRGGRWNGDGGSE